jgi:hypothetical protein
MFTPLTPFVSLSASPWPLVLSLSVINLILSVVLWFHLKVGVYTLLFSLALLIVVIFV